MMKLTGLAGAAAVAALLASGGARADYAPTATGGERKVGAWEWANDAHTRARIAVTHTFTNTEEAATLTFHKDATADILVVGGGGGGGTGGGGGGAGQFLYNEGVGFIAGGYAVTVGAGGADNSGGSASSISNSAGTAQIALAVGGGKGGATNTVGGNGANGGGGGVIYSDQSATSRSGGASTVEGGHAGGGSAKNSTAGGGGGAGHDGYDYNDEQFPGCGGEGEIGRAHV